MTAQTLDVVCIGNALVDVLAKADDAFLTTHGIPKGSMTLIDAARALQLYDAMGPAVEVSGGSAGHTATGVASLGGRAAFPEIGRASWRARVCPFVSISGVTVTLQKKNS